jgi:predicted transcriptional regulator
MSKAASTGSPVPLQVSEDLVRRLDRVAQALDRSRSWVVSRALRLYLDEHEEEILLTAQGLAELDRGEGVDFDEAMASVEAIIEQAERKRATKG